VHTHDRQYKVRIKVNPLYLFPFEFFVLFCFFRTGCVVCPRCECGICQPMPTAHESVCCAEISQVWQKVEDQRPEIQMSCITEHPGFQSNCLDVWVLETAYYAFRQQYGADNRTAHEKFRYVAYRQLVRWCWGYLGKHVRVALPSCAVNKIRSTFPADFGSSYTGLKPPNL